MAEASANTAALSISAVERDTGLSKDTLRVWERRYGFPQPVRDELGERSYPPAQLDKLRLIARLVNRGLRPGKVVPLETSELRQLVQDSAVSAMGERPLAQDLQVCIDLVKRHQGQQLRHWLSQATLRLGLAQVVNELVSPLNVLIGEAWARSELQVFEEHIYTESVTSVLRSAINSIPATAGPGHPRVLLTTFSQETHGLGLLMAETLLALEGCHCVSLGVQTPVTDIVLAAAADKSDIVGLSFSASLKMHQVLRNLQELREKLPASTHIWAGGGNPALSRLSMPGITPVPELALIKPLLVQWRTAQGSEPKSTAQ
jgi:DNA-binding transcriptional MerR regulator/methylmalonyl-CoA mutase cobalamin-binding subunit